MKSLFALTAATLITLSTPSQARDLLLQCSGMPTDVFEQIEVYDAPDGLEVVTKAPCEPQQSHIVQDVHLMVEANIPLPSAGGQQRLLQWRHTGFYLTTYTDGVADRFPIDCQ